MTTGQGVIADVFPPAVRGERRTSRRCRRSQRVRFAIHAASVTRLLPACLRCLHQPGTANGLFMIPLVRAWLMRLHCCCMQRRRRAPDSCSRHSRRACCVARPHLPTRPPLLLSPAAGRPAARPAARWRAVPIVWLALHVHLPCRLCRCTLCGAACMPLLPPDAVWQPAAACSAPQPLHNHTAPRRTVRRAACHPARPQVASCCHCCCCSCLRRTSTRCGRALAHMIDWHTPPAHTAHTAAVSSSAAATMEHAKSNTHAATSNALPGDASTPQVRPQAVQGDGGRRADPCEPAPLPR